MNYLLEEKEKYLTEKRKYFTEKDYKELELIIENLDSQAFENVMNTDLKNPIVMIIISILLGNIGVDRFILGDGKLGVLKLVTSGGFFVWWIIDIFTTSKRTKERNMNVFRGLINGSYSVVSAKEKFENLKNNKELQAVLMKGAKDITSASKNLHNTMYMD